MADIQLSPQLLQDMQSTVERHHPGADLSVTLQYLAAVTGYMLASQPQIEAHEQRRFLEDLCQFASKVHGDVLGQREQQQAAAQQSAFGIWEPGS